MKSNKLLRVSTVSVFMSLLTCVFFYYPFFKFVANNVAYNTFSGGVLLTSFIVVALVANAFVYYLFLHISSFLGKILIALSFLINAVVLYFITTYGVIIDESMIGNIFNTNYEESSAYFSVKMLLFFIFLGLLPVVLFFKLSLRKDPLKVFLRNVGLCLLLLGVIVVLNARSVLWIDKNSKQLGGLAMPWNYVINTILYKVHKSQENEKEILLPNAQIVDNQKAVMVLVIGESARRENFSLYGYAKNTNPQLSRIENLHHYNATSCATYTTAGVKCILEHAPSDKLYEILPNYLSRTGVNVVWRTANWGEPPVHIEKYRTASELRTNSQRSDANFDGVLLSGLRDEILDSNQSKTLIVIHTSTSHGPSYNKKYPAEYEYFTPVCASVELSECSKESLVNAYDNTIVYTDALLAEVIRTLEDLPEYQSAMLFVSDHGESLGEKNLYMHGLPMSLAPAVQYEIPFIAWSSQNTKQPQVLPSVTQGHVFHSVLSFLSLQSPVYNNNLDIFEVK